MPENRNRFAPGVDRLECRFALSAAAHALVGVMGVSQGRTEIPAPSSDKPEHRIPLSLVIGLPADERPRGHIHQKNSGGFTYLKVVTIEGRTTPGSFVISDSPAKDYTFKGPFVYADANGRFAFTVRLKNKLTNNEFLIIDPFGQHLIRAFPIRRLP